MFVYVVLFVVYLVGNRFYYLCVGSDVILFGVIVRSDFYWFISDRDYLYCVDYGVLEKVGIVVKNICL